MSVLIHQENIINWVDNSTEEPFHALLCDPPYEIGLHGTKWDRSGVALNPVVWKKLSNFLLPGAFGMVFAAARGWHRLACAIEDADLQIYPSIFSWCHAGFPKTKDFSATISKQFGNTFGEIWKGYRYGLQALKPAVEPIIVFQKPYEGSPIENISRTGAGSLNIDAARVQTNTPHLVNRWDKGAHPFGGGAGNDYSGTYVTGRWPANVVFSEDTATSLDERTNKPISSFFNVVSSQLDEADPVFYTSKVRNFESTDITKYTHPTPKPLELTKWLASLLLPPAEYFPRRLLVPFSGIASECIGAKQAGWDEIVGIEKTKGYCQMAKKRLAFYG